MANEYIKQIKVGNTLYDLSANRALTATSAVSAEYWKTKIYVDSTDDGGLKPINRLNNFYLISDGTYYPGPAVFEADFSYYTLSNPYTSDINSNGFNSTYIDSTGNFFDCTYKMFGPHRWLQGSWPIKQRQIPNNTKLFQLPNTIATPNVFYFDGFMALGPTVFDNATSPVCLAHNYSVSFYIQNNRDVYVNYIDTKGADSLSWLNLRSCNGYNLYPDVGSTKGRLYINAYWIESK